MNLIRNGGFESGSIGYWMLETTGAFVYDSTQQYTGNGCGKITSAGAVSTTVYNQDYIEVNPYQTFMIGGYIKSAAVRTARVYVLEYDQDLTAVGEYNLAEVITSAGYTSVKSLYVARKGVAYIRLRIQVRSSLVDEIFYIDGLEVSRAYIPDVCFEKVDLADRVVAGVSGNTAGNRKDMKVFETYIADLYVFAATGVTPTLDIDVYELSAHYDPILINSFAQASAIGGERIVLTNLTGAYMYVVYTIGGTTPSFDFSVAVTGKR